MFETGRHERWGDRSGTDERGKLFTPLGGSTSTRVPENIFVIKYYGVLTQQKYYYTVEYYVRSRNIIILWSTYVGREGQFLPPSLDEPILTLS